MFSAWRSSAGAPLIIRLVEAPFSAAGPTKSRTKSLCSPTRLLPTSPSRSRHSPSSDPSTREVVGKNIPIKSSVPSKVPPRTSGSKGLGIRNGLSRQPDGEWRFWVNSKKGENSASCDREAVAMTVGLLARSRLPITNRGKSASDHFRLADHLSGTSAPQARFSYKPGTEAGP